MWSLSQVKLSRTRKAGDKTLQNASAAAEATKNLDLARQAERMAAEFAAAAGDGSEAELLAEANKKLDGANKKLAGIRTKVKELQDKVQSLEDGLMHATTEKNNAVAQVCV